MNLTLQALKDRYRIAIDGRLFGEYVFKDTSDPLVVSLRGAHGLRIAPATGKPVAGEDPLYRRALRLAHGNVNGHNFWRGAGRIVQDRLSGSHGNNVTTIISDNRWVVGSGKRELVVCRDRRAISLHVQHAGRFLDYEVKLHASEGDVVFGDMSEGLLAMHLRPELVGVTEAPDGGIRNANGLSGKKAWSQRAAWIDCSASVGGKIVGVAIFDHPANHGHPCHWKFGTGGRVAANPIGAPRLDKGKTMTMRYRVFLHGGDTSRARVAEQFAKYAKMWPRR